MKKIGRLGAVLTAAMVSTVSPVVALADDVQPGTTTTQPGTSAEPSEEAPADQSNGSIQDDSDSDSSSEDQGHVVSPDPSTRPGGETAQQPGTSTDTPVEPVEPVEPAQPAQPVQPVQPVEVEEPAQPVQPVQPVEVEQPARPVQPVEPVQPAQPAQPVQPVEPVQPAQPAQPVQPVEPVQPVATLSASGMVNGEMTAVEDQDGIHVSGQWNGSAVDAQVSHPDDTGMVTAKDNVTGQSLSWSVQPSIDLNQYLNQTPFGRQINEGVKAAQQQTRFVDVDVAGTRIKGTYAGR